MDHWATRYPTNVEDIAKFLVEFIEKHPTQKLPSILHFSASEPYTKYEMCLVFAGLLDVPYSHIVPEASEPVIPPGGVGRPKDCRLSVRSIEAPVSEGGLGMTVDCGLFEAWWREEIAPLTGRDPGAI